MAVLAAAHVCDDANQSFLPALLPFLVIHRGLDFASAATLILAANASSSVVQPAIGWLADKRPMPWLIALGVFLAGAGVALVGVAPSYPWMLAAAFISGIGIATFHPEAGRFANFVAGDRKASGMRWFAAGGNAGFAIGPLFATMALALFGLSGTLLAVIPVAAIAIVVVLELPRLRGFHPSKTAAKAPLAIDNWPAFLRLSLFVTVRSMAFIGLVAFVPLYFTSVLHTSPAVGSIALTILLGAGVLGTVTGGPVADRVGRKLVLMWSTGATALLVLCFTLFTSHVTLIPLAFLGTAAIGFALVASQASYIVLGQEYLPNRIGLASGSRRA